MSLGDPETHQLLNEARAKAEHLLAEMLQRQGEIEVALPDLSPEQLRQGREAFEKAIDSARRLLQNLVDAQRIAAIDMN